MKIFNKRQMEVKLQESINLHLFKKWVMNKPQMALKLLFKIWVKHIKQEFQLTGKKELSNEDIRNILNSYLENNK